MNENVYICLTEYPVFAKGKKQHSYVVHHQRSFISKSELPVVYYSLIFSLQSFLKASTHLWPKMIFKLTSSLLVNSTDSGPDLIQMAKASSRLSVFKNLFKKLLMKKSDRYLIYNNKLKMVK